MLIKFLHAIKKLRKAAGMTQAEFGSLIGMNQAYVSRLESGNHNPEAETLQAVAEALDAEIVFVPRRALGRVNAIINEYAAPRSGPTKPYEGSPVEDLFIPDGSDDEDSK
jgi:transcriptional regulator with XRE-family HTH domain